MRLRIQILSALVSILMVAGGILFAADTTRRETVIWNFVNGVKLSLITADTAQNTALIVPDNSIGGREVSGVRFDLVFCGQAAENGTIYLSPAAGINLATFSDGGIQNIASTVCDGLDGATEATQDLVLFPLDTVKIMGFYCMTNGTLGAAETLTMTMRSAAADLTPSITCAMTEAQQSCKTLTGTTTNIAAGATFAMKAVEVSDNSDDDIWCSVSVMLQSGA